MTYLTKTDGRNVTYAILGNVIAIKTNITDEEGKIHMSMVIITDDELKRLAEIGKRTWKK